MRITLMHNPNAGGERHEAQELQGLLTDAGHAVSYHEIQTDGLAAALADPGELVVVAGGDGAIKKVAKHLVGRGIPLTVLPLGTANNIARTLRIAGSPAALVSNLAAARRQRFDVGMVSTSSGQTTFFESVGAGLFARALSVADAAKADAPSRVRTAPGRVARDLRLLRRILGEMPTSRCTVLADGENISGDYFLCEVLNIRSIGPNLVLAPDADAGDGWLDLVLLEERDRARLLVHLADPLDRSRSLPHLPVRRVRRVLLSPGPVEIHIDDALEPVETGAEGSVTLDVRLRPRALEFLIPQTPAGGADHD